MKNYHFHSVSPMLCQLNETDKGPSSHLWAPLRGKGDGVIGHISKRENVNRTKKIAILRDRSICHPA